MAKCDVTPLLESRIVQAFVIVRRFDLIPDLLKLPDQRFEHGNLLRRRPASIVETASRVYPAGLESDSRVAAYPELLKARPSVSDQIPLVTVFYGEFCLRTN